ncbi:16096_t:CDS:2, partial [Acaulospora colombiana]
PPEARQTRYMENAVPSTTTGITDPEYQQGEPRPHHRFYFEAGDLLIRVNNAIFKIHRDVIARRSVVIRDMFTLPSSTTQDQRTVDVIVQGDRVTAWERMIELLYP